MPDLLQNRILHPDVHQAIEEHLVQADTEALLIEKASVERNPFNQIMDAVKKNKEE